jgi:hypothetical protein
MIECLAEKSADACLKLQKGTNFKNPRCAVDWGGGWQGPLAKVVRVLALAAAPRSRSWQAIVTDEKV